MKPAEITREPTAQALDAALQTLGIDGAEAEVYWHAVEMDEVRVLVASPLGLLVYKHAEVANRTHWLMQLQSVTPWREVTCRLQVSTGRDEDGFVSGLTLWLEQLPDGKVSAFTNRDGSKLIVDFATACLRWTMSGKGTVSVEAANT